MCSEIANTRFGNLSAVSCVVLGNGMCSLNLTPTNWIGPQSDISLLSNVCLPVMVFLAPCIEFLTSPPSILKGLCVCNCQLSVPGLLTAVFVNVPNVLLWYL